MVFDLGVFRNQPAGPGQGDPFAPCPFAWLGEGDRQAGPAIELDRDAVPLVPDRESGRLGRGVGMR